MKQAPSYTPVQRTPNDCENPRRARKEDRGERQKERGGGGGGGLGGGGESQGECVWLSFSSPESDREQPTEDNEKQIFGGEEGEGGGTEEEEGRGGRRKEEWGKREKKKRKGGGEGRVTAKKGGLSCSSPQEISPLMFTK